LAAVDDEMTSTPASLTLIGRTILITGAQGGIGQALVARFLEAGAARVYAAGRAAVRGAGDSRVVPVRLDITDEVQVRAAAESCSDVEILVNNAGINRNRSLMAAADLSDARLEMETNYFGTLAMCRAFAPVLAANGGGAIVNVLSIGAKIGLPFMGSLCASKAAALRLTECMRAELAAQGTHVLAVLPGAVDTPMTRHLGGIRKLAPFEVARTLVTALCAGAEEVCVGPEAERIDELLCSPRLRGETPKRFP
jgi:NAD(P)-dependent dehydrogenase (short-subunit alcohol dehydrogenase family)